MGTYSILSSEGIGWVLIGEWALEGKAYRNCITDRQSEVNHTEFNSYMNIADKNKIYERNYLTRC